MPEDIFTGENVERGLLYLTEKKNSCGSDGVMLYDLQRYLETNPIIEQLQNGTYLPKPALAISLFLQREERNARYSDCLPLIG